MQTAPAADEHTVGFQVRLADVSEEDLVLLTAGWLVGKGAGLVIERLRVPIPAGTSGEFSSPEFTLCADSYSVSVPPPCYRNGT